MTCPAWHAVQAVAPPPTEYVATGQSRHRSEVTRPSSSEAVPAGQGRHVSLPTRSDHVPAEQGRHAPAPSAPSTGCRVPAGHSRQMVFRRYRPDRQGSHAATLCALRGEDVPAGQAVHAAAPAPLNVPAGHSWQTDSAKAPSATENVPAGQASQSAEELAPTFRVHIPAGQSVHTMPPPSCSAAYWPRRHAAQFDADVAPGSSADVAPGHSAHSSSATSPRLAPYRLAGRGVHPCAEATPSTSEYVPSGHFTHPSADAVPADGPYVPTRQDKHAPPAVGWYLPAGHRAQTPSAPAA